MSVSQQVVYQPPSGDIKYVDGPPGAGADGSGTMPGSGGDGGDGSSPPVSGGGDGGGSSPPVAGGGDGGGSSPPVAGGGSTPPGAGGGDGSTPPGAGGGDGSTPPVAGGGDGSTPPVAGGGDGSTPPGAGGGDGSTPPGAGGGDGSTPPVAGGGDGSAPPGAGGGVTIGIDPVLTVGLGGTDGDGLSVNVLTPPDATDSHGVNVNVLGDGNGQNLLDVGLLPSTGGLGLPGGGGAGSGSPLDLGSLLSVTPSGTDGSGLSVNALTGPDATDAHGLNVNLLDTGDGHNLLDVGVLPSTGGLGLPGSGGAGSGSPLDLGSLLSVTPSGTDGSGLSVNALTGPDATDAHGLNVNLLDTGDGHNLLDVGVLPSTGGLGLPGIGGAGSGSPLDLGSLLSVTPSGTDGSGLSVNALTGPDSTDAHGLNVNLLDTGDGHNLLDVGVLPSTGGLGLPGIGDAGAGNPLGDLVGGSGLAGGLLHAEGGLLNGTVGDLNGSSTGHLIDLDLGPETPNGLGLDLLSVPGADPNHSVSVSAVDVGPNGPQLADFGVLTGAGILDIPSLGGTGTDGITGDLLGSDGLLGGLLGGAGIGGGILNGDIASGNTVSAPVTAPLDIAALTDAAIAPLTGDHGLLDLHAAHIL